MSQGHQILRAIAAEYLLEPHELKELNDAVTRVFELMRNGEWHSRTDICLAAGVDGVPASEGLRRMRALRSIYVLDKLRVEGQREWLYRIAGIRADIIPRCRQRELFS